jgi:hypothetical protein
MEWPRPPFASDEMAKIPLKQNVATRIAMHIAKVHLSMGDQVELWIFSDDSSNSLPERYFKPRDSLQILNVFEDLLAANFSKATFFQKFVPQVFQGKISDFVYWVGDGLSHSDYGTFLAKGKRPCFIHTLSSLEVDISWMSADVCYFDESLERKEYLGQSLLASGNYLNGLHDWRHRLEKRMNKNQGGYLLATDQTATDYYMEFLSSIVMG